ADLMHRNLNRRVEALVTVVDPAQQAELRNLIALAMDETTASWWLDGDGNWTRHHLDSSGRPLRDLQQYLLASTRGRGVDAWPGQTGDYPRRRGPAVAARRAGAGGGGHPPAPVRRLELPQGQVAPG